MNENIEKTENVLAGVDADKLRRLKEKLGIGVPLPTREPSVEEIASAQKEEEGEEGIDWSKFDLPANVAHLYPHAKLVQTEEGPRWVALLDVFEFETAPYKKLGGIVTDMVNGEERWRIATVYGNGSGLGVVMFTRTVKIVLPNPVLLKTDADMPAPPTDEELKHAEDSAISWIESEGQKKEKEAKIIDVAAEQASAVDQPTLSLEGVGHIELNPPTERVPFGAGFNATDSEGTILPTSFESPARGAVAAGEEAAAALSGPDFEKSSDEGLSTVQVDISSSDVV